MTGKIQFYLRSNVIRSAHSGVGQPPPAASPALGLVPGETVGIPDDKLLLLGVWTPGSRLSDQIFIVLSAVRLIHSCTETKVCQLDMASGV